MKAYYPRAGSYSRSFNAEMAESEGRLPLTRAVPVVRAATGCTEKVARAALEAVWDGEWHHVGKYANEVNYYDTNEAIALVRSWQDAGAERERRKNALREQVRQNLAPAHPTLSRVEREMRKAAARKRFVRAAIRAAGGNEPKKRVRKRIEDLAARAVSPKGDWYALMSEAIAILKEVK